MTRYNQPKILYPKDFSLFAQCPEKYRRERIEKIRVDQGYSPALAIGIATHTILNDAAVEFRLQNSVPADLYPRAEALVPRTPYPSDAAWLHDVEVVVMAVKAGLLYLDGDAQVLSTETTFQYHYQCARDCPPFVLAAKVDLVLLRADADQCAYIDVIDFKTGASVKIDSFQELSTRIVVKQNAADRFDLGGVPIQSTTIFLGAGAVVSSVLDDAECGRRWQEMKKIAAAILAGDSFPPNPSALCEWCPFFGGICTLTPPNSHDNLGDWLDGAAD